MVHKFYFTNNLGGGGTNVSRLVDYKQLLDLPNIGLLLNYYYLTGQSVPKFDAYVIDKIRRYASIGDFLNVCCKKENFGIFCKVGGRFEDVRLYVGQRLRKYFAGPAEKWAL